MAESMDDVRQDIADARLQISTTSAELQEAVSDRVTQAKQTIDPRTYIRQYPWIALGLAVGAGLAIALTGADRSAAAGVVAGTKKAGGGIKSRLGSVADNLLHDGLHDILDDMRISVGMPSPPSSHPEHTIVATGPERNGQSAT